MKKKLVCLVLTALMVLSIMPATAFATQVKYERPLQFEENIATELKKLNLFKGVSETDFALRKVPTRIEALVIMLRLMGKEAEILAGEYKHPFNDVPSWANNYVGYAYENGLTKGISASKFGTDNATDVQFLTFVLRAMGYSDSNGDFTWDNPYKLAEDLGVLDCSVTTGKGFLRADCASISYNALGAKLKDNSGTLADKLIADGVFTKNAYDAAVKNVPDYAGMLTAYGLANMKWTEYPKTVLEYEHNFYLSYIRGNWEYDSADKMPSDWNFQLSRKLIDTFDSLYSEWQNVFIAKMYSRNGKFYINTEGEEPIYTKEQILNNLSDAYNCVVKLRDGFYKSVGDKEFATQVELVQAYCKYLGSIQSSFGPTPENMERFDSYIEFVNRVPSMKGCSGKEYHKYIENDDSLSVVFMLENMDNFLHGKGGPYILNVALLNMLVRFDGIEAYGLVAEKHGTSYLVLDGKAYVASWDQSPKGVFSLNDITAKLDKIPELNSLFCAEMERFNGDPLKCGQEYTGTFSEYNNNTNGSIIRGVNEAQNNQNPGRFVVDPKNQYFTPESNRIGDSVPAYNNGPTIHWEYIGQNGSDEQYRITLSSSNIVTVERSEKYSIIVQGVDREGPTNGVGIGTYSLGQLQDGITIILQQSTRAKLYEHDGYVSGFIVK